MSKKEKLKKKYSQKNAFTIEDFINKQLAELDFDSSHQNILKNNNNLFLGKFSTNDFYQMMEQVGLLHHLKNLGFKDILVKIEITEEGLNLFKAYHQKESSDNLLMDLKVSESKFIPSKKFFSAEIKPQTYDMIVIEWLSANNPQQKFSGDRPQLPGQNNPGLGILKYYFKLMYIVAKEVEKDGFLDIPDYVHGAIMYSRRFKFFDPAHEGVLQALLRDLKDYSLADISWGIITKTIIEKYKNEPQIYNPSEQIFYVSDKMKKYFYSSNYKKIFKKYYKRKKFRFDYDEMLKEKENILKKATISSL